MKPSMSDSNQQPNYHLRTEAMHEEYEAFLATRPADAPCRLCEMEPLVEYEYWKLTSNDFPYDRVAEDQKMLVLKRHATELEMTEAEKNELTELKHSGEFNGYFHHLMESLPATMSIPNHYHLHLLRWKTFTD